MLNYLTVKIQLYTRFTLDKCLNVKLFSNRVRKFNYTDFSINILSTYLVNLNYWNSLHCLIKCS